MALLVCSDRARSENSHRFKPNSNIRCEILLNVALLVFKVHNFALNARIYEGK